MIHILSVISVLLIVLSGCSSYRTSEQLFPKSYSSADAGEVDASFAEPQFAFSAELFRRCAAMHDENMLISPLSASYALGMCMNGAVGDTLSEIEAVLGSDRDTINTSLSAMLTKLDENFSAANSVWLRNTGLAVNDAFLDSAGLYYNADVFMSDFGSSAVKDINRWVNKKTDSMINDIVSDIPDTAVMYLINALAFDAAWEQEYEPGDIYDSRFTSYSGEHREVSMMRSHEESYLTDENTEGFMRPYAGGKYSFAALLPSEGTDIFDYAESLSYGKLASLFSDVRSEEVIACIPQFTSEYTLTMNDVLTDMGMTCAFDASNADFSDMAVTDTGALYISEVKQKMFIEVTPSGTRAAAVTSVMMEAGSAMPDPVPTVVLNRPFVYMIIENSTGIPLFMGIVTSVD